MNPATAVRCVSAPAPAKTWPVVHGHWLKGCMGQVQREPLSLYHNAWKQYGDFVKLRALPGIYFYLLTHPDAVEHVLAPEAPRVVPALPVADITQ